MVSPSGTRKRQAMKRVRRFAGCLHGLHEFFVPAGSGINRLVIVVRVRRAGGGLDVLARAGAGINEISGAQFFQRGAVKIHPLALVVRRKWPADVRAFAPFKTEPAQVFKHRVHKFHFEARGVQIFVAQNQIAAVRARAFLRGPERPRMAEMQMARRRRRKPAAIFRIGICELRIHSRE